MKLFKIVGENKKTVKLAEEFCEKIGFERVMLGIISESMALDIPYDQTEGYKKFMKQYLKKNDNSRR